MLRASAMARVKLHVPSRRSTRSAMAAVRADVCAVSKQRLADSPRLQRFPSVACQRSSLARACKSSIASSRPLLSPRNERAVARDLIVLIVLDGLSGARERGEALLITRLAHHIARTASERSPDRQRLPSMEVRRLP